jgi:hypothetical protein
MLNPDVSVTHQAATGPGVHFPPLGGAILNGQLGG